MANPNILDVIIKTVEYGAWATYAQFSDSPEHEKTHKEMREHLKLVAGLNPHIQAHLSKYVSRII